MAKKARGRVGAGSVKIAHQGQLLIQGGAHTQISINIMPAAPAPRKRTRSRKRKEAGNGHSR